MINVSMNELSSLLKRSFEGLGYCQADYEDGAAAIVWLEAHGMKGLETIASITEHTPDPANRIDIGAEEADGLVLDAKGSNVAFCGRMAVDLACANVSAASSGRVELRHCHGRKAILPSLSLCAARGFNAIARWSDEDCLYVSPIKAQQRAPDFFCVQRMSDDNACNTSLVVVCSKNPQDIEAIKARFLGGDSDERSSTKITSSDMQERYNESLRNGLNVDKQFVKKLTAAADAVLVEATEQSRLGAGESPS